MAVAGARIADRYVLTAEVGAGGMGVVWKARDTRLERDVAVKLLPAGAVGDDVARARLLREAKAAGSLQHDGIVRIYDVGEADAGSAFLVMELVVGSSLRDTLSEGRLTRRERLDVVVQIARALAVAHEAGIIHRDVKPENVLVRPDKRPILLDFGLAKPIPSGLAKTIDVGAGPTNITQEGSVVGTPAYLAPEQIRGDEAGAAADQFALGVTAFELLTGRMPFVGSSVLAVLASVLHETPPLASKVCADVSAPVAEVLARAMRRDPSTRWPNVSAFADALEVAASETADGPVPAVPKVSPSARTMSDATAARDADVPPSAAESASRPWARVAVVAGSIALAGVLGGRFLARDAGQVVTPPSSSVAALPLDAVVACPLFKVSGDALEEPTGWLGAAAAALACERAQDLLGGASSRALGPADLAGLPRDATDVGADDPFAAAETRTRTEAAAVEKTARLVGTVTKAPHAFVVDLIVRARDGHDLAHATGRGEELVEAVSVAIRGVAAVFGDPRASAFQKAWLRVDSREAALDLRDLASALMIEDDVLTAAACARVAGRSDVRPDMLYLARALCHERLARRSLDESPPPIDESSPGALATTVAAHRARGGIEEVRKRVALLERAIAKAEEPDERVILSAAAAEVLYAGGDNPRARELSRVAVRSSPKLVDLRGTPWHRLTVSGTFDSHVTRAHASWIPWEPVALQNLGGPGLGTPYLTRLKAVGRAALLAQRGFFVSSYCEQLTRAGRSVEAEGIADQLDSDLLRVRVLIGQGRYKAAIERGTAKLAELPATDTNAGQAFRLASAVSEAAHYVGKPATFVDDVVVRYLDAEPPHVRIGIVPFVALLHACASAPAATGERCIRRLKQLFARGDLGGLVSAAPAMMDGAERWVTGDVEGAAKIWRPLVREASTLEVESLRHVMAEAFDRSGMMDLGARLDADILTLADQPGAMDPAFPRGAIRAEKTGDFATARKLATVALTKWRTADDDVPAALEMKALVKRIEGR